MFLRLYILLLVAVVASASWVAFGATGGLGICILLLAWMVLHAASKLRFRQLFRVAAGMLCLIALACLLLPAMNAARETARCIQCTNNLKQIGLALRNYWDCHGCYPPPCTCDTAGRPLHSWRLFIMPFLSCEPTYDMCNLNEAWDGPSNGKALARVPYVYCCPKAWKWPPESNTTNFIAVVGRKAAWRASGHEGHEDHDTQKRKAGTFLVIETGNSNIRWMEPKDIYFDDVEALRSLAANSPHSRGNGYFFHDTPGVNAVLVDGDMMFMFPCVSAFDVLATLLPPKEQAGARNDKHNALDDFYTEELRVNWLHCIGLPVWIVAAGLLFFQVTFSRRTRRNAVTPRA
jgi:hypothetical protein